MQARNLLPMDKPLVYGHGTSDPFLRMHVEVRKQCDVREFMPALVPVNGAEGSAEDSAGELRVGSVEEEGGGVEEAKGDEPSSARTPTGNKRRPIGEADPAGTAGSGGQPTNQPIAYRGSRARAS